MKKGNKMLHDHTIYLKKLGIEIPSDSAMDLTIKLGAFPIYVKAPIKTAPNDMAFKVDA